MKKIYALMALFPLSLIAAPLTLTVTVNGKDISDFQAPSVTFTATSKLCLRGQLLPLPAIYPKSISAKTKMKFLSNNTIELQVPTHTASSVCGYKLNNLNFSFAKTFEYISFVSTEFLLNAQEVKELDLLTNPFSVYVVESANGRSRILKDGSQIGYGNGNVGYLYLNALKMDSNIAQKASVTINFK